MRCRFDALAPRAPSPPRIPIPSRAAALPHHSSTSRLLPTRHHSLRSPPAPPFPPERRNSQGPHRRSINRGSGAVLFRKQRIANETSSRGRGSPCPRSAIRLLPPPDFSPPFPAVPPHRGPPRPDTVAVSAAPPASTRVRAGGKATLLLLLRQGQEPKARSLPRRRRQRQARTAHCVRPRTYHTRPLRRPGTSCVRLCVRPPRGWEVGAWMDSLNSEMPHFAALPCGGALSSCSAVRSRLRRGRSQTKRLRTTRVTRD